MRRPDAAVVPDVAAALSAALSGCTDDDVLVVTGSLYFLTEVYAGLIVSRAEPTAMA
jgi:folylpolyglutamate synthase/dihydropteroate synthase